MFQRLSSCLTPSDADSVTNGPLYLRITSPCCGDLISGLRVLCSCSILDNCPSAPAFDLPFGMFYLDHDSPIFIGNYRKNVIEFVRMSYAHSVRLILSCVLVSKL